VIKFDGVEGSAIIDASPGNVGGQIPRRSSCRPSLENVQEFRVESNNYPAEFGTGTGGQVTSSPSPARSGVGLAVSSTTSKRQVRRPLLLRLERETPTAASSRSCPVGGLTSTSSAAIESGRAVLEKPAPSSSPATKATGSTPASTREAAPSAAAWSRAVPAIAPAPSGLHGAEPCCCRRVGQTPTSNIYQLQGLENVEENSFSCGSTTAHANVVVLRRVFSDRGEQRVPKASAAASSASTDEPTNAHLQPEGHVGDGMLNEFKVGYNAPQLDDCGVAPTVERHRFQQHRDQPDAVVANTGIAGQSASSGIVVPGGLVRASSATNGRGSSTTRLGRVLRSPSR
jgi:hypothetical protein